MLYKKKSCTAGGNPTTKYLSEKGQMRKVYRASMVAIVHDFKAAWRLII